MDVLNTVIQVPSWAYDFCYYYFAVAVIVALYSVYTLVQLFLMPGAYRRVVPFISTILALALSSVVSIVLALMQFWVCRSALKPAAPAAGAKKEAFAVACKSGEDCTAVTGTPQGSTCTCSGRGFCGGCVMQNNMEPQAEFAAAFAPFNEGFAGMAPAQARSRRA